MRNTTFTKVFIFCFLPVAASADPACYTREYSDAHLAKNPKQVVKSMRLLMSADPKREGVRLEATLADQGHVIEANLGGQTLSQGLFCLPEDGPLRCGVECDGGLMTVTRDDGEVLEFRTNYLLVGDSESCGGTADLAEEIGKPVTYRLFKTEISACEGM